MSGEPEKPRVRNHNLETNDLRMLVCAFGRGPVGP